MSQVPSGYSVTRCPIFLRQLNRVLYQDRVTRMWAEFTPKTVESFVRHYSTTPEEIIAGMDVGASKAIHLFDAKALRQSLAAPLTSLPLPPIDQSQST